jgi:succinate dehydrogenase hydrophobic anchor subunit
MEAVLEMRKRTWFAGVTAAVSVPLIIAVLFVSLANVSLTRPEVYHQALLQQDFYNRFSGIVARQLAFYFHQEGISVENIREDIPAQNEAHHLQDVLPL